METHVIKEQVGAAIGQLAEGDIGDQTRYTLQLGVHTRPAPAEMRPKCRTGM